MHDNHLSKLFHCRLRKWKILPGKHICDIVQNDIMTDLIYSNIHVSSHCISADKCNHDRKISICDGEENRKDIHVLQIYNLL